MSERIRLGNVYEHEEHGTVLTTHRDYNNMIWFRSVEGRDNAGVISTGERVEQEDYKQFLGSVTMRDYPDDWDRIASAVKQRDQYTCQSCGSSTHDVSDSESDESPRGCGDDDATELHAHHIVPLGAGGSNARSNLLTLCDECHGRVHGGVT